LTAVPALELEKISMDFGRTVRVRALTDVSLSIAPGEVCALTGPTGSGKSTLLAIMGTLERPSAGRVQVEGVDVATARDRTLARLRAQRIGFVFQTFQLHPRLSALGNVEQGLAYSAVPPAERRERAVAALADVGLADRAEHLPTQLSGGEQQRVAIARALAKEPSILLADEPTGNLDQAAAEMVVDLLLDGAGRQRALVLVTHNDALAGRLPRVVRLERGRLVADGSNAAA
jgi:putative ABC transport system ATP-binding protein